MMKFKKLVLAAALGAVSFSANAYISSWDWQTSTGFLDLGTADALGAPIVYADDGSLDDGNVFNASDTPYAPAGQEYAPGPDTRDTPEDYFSNGVTNDILSTNVWETMSWGIPSTSSTNGLRSSIDITNMSSTSGADALETNGDWVIINDFTHNNYVLAGGSSNSPWSAMLFGGFLFTTGGVDYLNQGAGSPQPISLNETSNVSGCEFPTPNNTVCDDIFTTSGLSGSMMFHIDWEEHLVYWVEFAFFEGEGNADIIDEPSPGVYNIYTGENGSTTIHTVARVFTREVPEPAIIGLFGIGLLGMGLIGRRRKS